MKAFEEDKKSDCNTEICLKKGRKHYRTRRKCLLQVFSPFPTLFSKVFLLMVINIQDCVDS